MLHPASSPPPPAWPWAAAAAAAPLLATASVGFLFAIRGISHPDFAFTPAWAAMLLVALASGLAATFFVWWSALRGGSAIPPLAAAAAPWALALPLALLGWREMAAMAAPESYLYLLSPDPSDLPRVMGLSATWSLAGGVALGLSVAAVGWRAGRPRLLDVVVAAGSVLPLLALAAWHIALHRLVPAWLAMGVVVLCLMGVIYLGLAAVARPAGGAAPADRFRLAVAAAVLLAALAALAVYQAFGLANIGLALQAVGPVLTGDPEAGNPAAILDELGALHRFRIIGSVLALLPLLAMAGRTPRSTLLARRTILPGATAAVAFLLLLLADVLVERPRTGILEAIQEGRPLEEALGGMLPAPADPAGGIETDASWPPPPPPAPVGGVPGGIPGGVPGGAEAAGAFAPAEVHTRIFPTIPAGALAAGERRTTILRLTIDATGAVTDATVVRSATPALDAAAIAAARATTYTPATRDGVPVPDSQVATYQFVGE